MRKFFGSWPGLLTVIVLIGAASFFLGWQSYRWQAERERAIGERVTEFMNSRFSELGEEGLQSFCENDPVPLDDFFLRCLVRRFPPGKDGSIALIAIAYGDLERAKRDMGGEIVHTTVWRKPDGTIDRVYLR